MSKMSDIDVTIQEYEENLHTFGHMDPMVVTLKRELLTYGISEINTLVECIDHEFNTVVFNNQTEGRF